MPKNKHRRDKVRLDTHVEKARHDADGVVGVDGREHEVAGERRLHRQLGGLGVADLADHDDVWVLAERGAQTVGERVADFGAHLRLARRRGSCTRPGLRAKARFAFRGRPR